MPFKPIEKKEFYLNVVKPIHVIIKQDLDGHHWGKVYDSGTLVYGGFAMQSQAKAHDDVMEWIADNYTVTKLKPKQKKGPRTMS